MTDPKHIDAVEILARAIADDEGFVWPEMEHAREVWRKKAHAAMLDALTRHGVLTEENAPLSFRIDGAGWYARYDGQHTDEGRRLVTSWEVAE